MGPSAFLSIFYTCFFFTDFQKILFLFLLTHLTPTEMSSFPAIKKLRSFAEHFPLACAGNVHVSQSILTDFFFLDCPERARTPSSSFLSEFIFSCFNLLCSR